MASNHQYFKQGAILCASEGTYGTDALDGNLGGTNAYTYQSFETCSITPVTELLPDDPIRQSFSGFPHDLIKRHSAVSITGFLRGATNPGNAGGESINALPLWLCSGWSSSVSSGVSDTLTPTTTQPSGMTLYHFLRNAEDAAYRLSYVTGVRGNVSINLVLGSYATFEFSGLGINWPDTADTANFRFWSDDLSFFDSNGKIVLDKDGSTAIGATSGTVQYDTRPKFKVVSVTATIDGTSYPLSRFSFSLNREAVPNQDINSSGNTQSIYTMPTDRPGGQMQIAGTAAAYDSFLTAWHDSTEVDISVVLDNGTDTLTISTPGDNAQLYAPSRTDVSGKAEWGAEWRINGAYSDPAGDDGVSMVYAAS